MKRKLLSSLDWYRPSPDIQFLSGKSLPGETIRAQTYKIFLLAGWGKLWVLGTGSYKSEHEVGGMSCEGTHVHGGRGAPVQVQRWWGLAASVPEWGEPTQEDPCLPDQTLTHVTRPIPVSISYPTVSPTTSDVQLDRGSLTRILSQSTMQAQEQNPSACGRGVGMCCRQLEKLTCLLQPRQQISSDPLWAIQLGGKGESLGLLRNTWSPGAASQLALPCALSCFQHSPGARRACRAHWDCLHRDPLAGQCRQPRLGSLHSGKLSH